MARRRSTTRPSNTIGQGLGYNARNEWSGERTTPNREQQLVGFYVGQVVDDQDDQRMGRVWVYIPQVSSKRFDDQSLPTYGGTTPDRQNPEGLTYDQKLRLGWVLLSPMTPFFGSDDYRAQSAPDGRNSASGDVNSYGMWHQPRVGDYVGVLFAGGDPNSGYWTGMVPKQNSNGMVPGVPGAEVQNVSTREQAVSLEGVQPTARVSTMDKASTDGDPLSSDVVMTSDLARAQIKAGISGDIIRGAGTSGSRRESPSYVTGLKSAGWSYDSEKQNRNVDGQSQFQDDQQRYYNKNSVGHSFTMDDHPDHQSMRLRTSSGAQILMSDSCNNPFIYLQTASGNAWIEISDSGDITIFAGAGLHIHSEGDYNLTVDGNMNVGVAGDFHMRTSGDSATSVGGLSTEVHGSSLLKSVESEYDFNVGSNVRQTFGGDYDVRSPGSYSFTIGGGMDIISGGGIRQSVGGNMDFKVSGGTRYEIGGSQQITIGENLVMAAGGSSLSTAGGQTSIQSGGSFDVDAATVNLNSGSSTAAEPEVGTDFFPADMAAIPILPPLNKTTRAPGQSEIAGNAAVENVDSVAAVVPQHQPWGQRCGFGSTGGANGSVSSKPVEGGFIPPSANMTCDRNSNPNNIRTGSGFSASMVPDTIMGGLSSVPGLLPLIGAADGYRTDSKGETPNYRAVGLARMGETFKARDLALSVKGLEYIKSQEGFISSPKLDPLRGSYVVGYGHHISYGDTLSGSFMDSETLRRIASFTNDSEKSLTVTEDEAETYLLQDLEPTEAWVREQFTEVEFTQDQYDTVIAFVRNVTPEVLEAEDSGKKFIAAVKAGNFDQAQPSFYDFSYVGGAVDCNVLDRRRNEAARFGQYPDAGGITAQAIGYVPQGDTVTLAGFKIESEVFNAICNAYQSIAPQLPDGYLFAICAQESRFVPTAKASTSSAAGLFQFIASTGAQYGLSTSRASGSNVFDPVLNANAGAKFNLDNMNYLISRGISNVGPAELYAAHFMGPVGAVKFLTKLQANPSAPAAYDFPGPAAANQNIYYVRGDRSQPRSYTQVLALFAEKITNRIPYFAGICNAPPPINPPGDFKWVTGSRTPDFYKVDPRVRAIAEKSALAAGITELGFNSGYRDPAKNAAVDGASNSQHLYGKAIDIHIGNLSTAQQRAFVEQLAINGITGMGVGTNTLHIDIRNAGRVTWKYSGGNGHVRDILQKYGYRGA